MSLPIDTIPYKCVNDNSDLASWDLDKKVLQISARFLTLKLGELFLSVLTRGAPRFRAGVLLHEHVHRVEDPQKGTIPWPGRRTYSPVGSQEQTCQNSGTEYDGMYIQVLYYKGSIGMARAIADAYGRSRCDDISAGSKTLALIGDIVETLSLAWLKEVIIVAAFTGVVLVNPGAAITLLANLMPAKVLALLVLTVFPGPSGYP